MNEKQCVRCGRAGHDSAECKWLSVGGIPKEMEVPDCTGYDLGNNFEIGYATGWNECREAMLAAAEQVARDWPKLLEMARQIIRDGHVHDVGGGDLAVTTCEAFEGLDAFLKQHFPEPLGELTETERKWFEAKAAAQPPAVAGLHLNPTQVAALREVLRISDRQHDAWETLKAALKGNQ